jgi:PAS domain S-box-containing protein
MELPADIPAPVSNLLGWFQENVTRLEKAYSEMGRQVERINRELDQKNAELSATLAEQSLMRNRLSCLLESLHDGVVMVDVNERVVMFNARAGSILGLDPQDVLMRRLPEAFPQPALRAPLQGTLKDGEGRTRLEIRWHRLDGMDVPLGVSTALVRDPSGTRLGAVATFSDLSHLKTMERELVQSRTLAALGEMAATVAHEIRNPLGGIGGFAGLLARDIPADDPRHRLVGRIQEGVGSLNRTVTNLLAYTRRLELTPTDVDLPEWLGRLEEWASMEVADLCEGPVGLEFRHEGPAPSHFDGEKIRQVVINLCRNALQAMPTGGRLSLLTRREPSFLEIDVVDTGSGIDPDNLSRIFDPFFTTKENGTGLGLAIVRKIVEFHGGSIEASSEPGQGTRFRIRLPQQMEPWQES